MNPTPKRLVLHHATGPLAGLYQILGIAPPIEGTVPLALDYGAVGAERTATVVLNSPRMLQYKENA